MARADRSLSFAPGRARDLRPRCTRLFDSMGFRLNHQVLYEETDLLLRYGRCSFELLHRYGCGRRHVPVQLAMSLHLGGDARNET